MGLSMKYLAMDQLSLGKAAAKLKQREEEDGIGTMNVLDQIIAMVSLQIRAVLHLHQCAQIFSRMTCYDKPEIHYKQLAEVHSLVREKWVEEFGCLPPDALWRK